LAAKIISRTETISFVEILLNKPMVRLGLGLGLGLDFLIFLVLPKNLVTDSAKIVTDSVKKVTD